MGSDMTDVFVAVKGLKAAGCRSRRIINISKFRARQAISNTPARLIVWDHINNVTQRLVREIEGSIWRSIRDED